MGSVLTSTFLCLFLPISACLTTESFNSTSFNEILATYPRQRWALPRHCHLCSTLEAPSIIKEIYLNTRFKYLSVEHRHLNIIMEQSKEASHICLVVFIPLHCVLCSGTSEITSDQTQNSLYVQGTVLSALTYSLS